MASDGGASYMNTDGLTWFTGEEEGRREKEEGKGQVISELRRRRQRLNVEVEDGAADSGESRSRPESGERNL
jgi:hypothetical protein